MHSRCCDGTSEDGKSALSLYCTPCNAITDRAGLAWLPVALTALQALIRSMPRSGIESLPGIRIPCPDQSPPAFSRRAKRSSSYAPLASQRSTQVDESDACDLFRCFWKTHFHSATLATLNPVTIFTSCQAPIAWLHAVSHARRFSANTTGHARHIYLRGVPRRTFESFSPSTTT